MLNNWSTLIKMNTSEEQISTNEFVKEFRNIRDGNINFGHLLIDQVSEIINYVTTNWHVSINIHCFFTCLLI